jgi:hypothetical protein
VSAIHSNPLFAHLVVLSGEEGERVLREELARSGALPITSAQAEHITLAMRIAASAALRALSMSPCDPGDFLRLLKEDTLAGVVDDRLELEKPVAEDGAALIARERLRQIQKEGWTIEHDDTHRKGELLDAGLCYIYAAINVGHPAMLAPPREWPWDRQDWKPSDDRLKNIVRAGALFAAEADRILRARSAGPNTTAESTAPTPPVSDGQHEWWVFSTAIGARLLMLYCEKTGATGVVRNPTTEEWSRAFMAPSSPYRWHEPDRVEIDKATLPLETEEIGGA